MHGTAEHGSLEEPCAYRFLPSTPPSNDPPPTPPRTPLLLPPFLTRCPLLSNAEQNQRVRRSVGLHSPRVCHAGEERTRPVPVISDVIGHLKALSLQPSLVKDDDDESDEDFAVRSPSVYHQLQGNLNAMATVSRAPPLCCSHGGPRSKHIKLHHIT